MDSSLRTAPIRLAILGRCAVAPANSRISGLPTQRGNRHHVDMETKARRLTELIAARDELTRRYADVRRKHNDARTAVLAAASGGIGSHVPLRDAGAAAPLTLAQLAEWAKQCEAEAAEIRELLTQVDVRIAEVSAQALGYAH